MKVSADMAGSELLKRALADIERKQLRVGWFDTAKYEDGTPVAYVATIQEFGYQAGGIPARPFMRPTINAQRNAWRDSLRQGFKTAMGGRRTVEQVLDIVGMMAAGQIGEKISTITSPALSPRTIAARASKRKSPGVSTKPLVDTGLMIQSISSQVTEK